METLPAFRAETIRNDFPALHQKVYNKPLVYLDNAATTQKPSVVIQRLSDYYANENCNIHRGVHYLSQQATAAFEQARAVTARFIGAQKAHEVIFTKGTTESINLMADSLGRLLMKNGGSVLITGMEHHANLIPWQQLCLQHQGKLLVTRLNEKGEIDLDHFAELLKQGPVIAAFAHISNALGTISPVAEMIRLAHDAGVPVLIDGAQSIAHCPVDVTELDCDFFVFSGHKVYAPMGVGVLYGKEEWLLKMPPYQFGGEMVDQVSFEKTSFNDLPFKFEAGTPNVGAVLGLETALNYLNRIGVAAVGAYEHSLIEHALAKLSAIDGLRVVGQAAQRASVISFLIGDSHPYDGGTLLDKMGFAVRTGHHCAQPVMDIFGVPGTIRASIAMYNTFDEVDRLCEAVQRCATMLT
ncbi:MAG: SufS family cysteine desulfurase [Bacteroidetes bacterium]|nr:SufS family cysteine desulfurase [Bacteroidota bacterium]